jgi:hypothetical protein
MNTKRVINVTAMLLCISLAYAFVWHQGLRVSRDLYLIGKAEHARNLNCCLWSYAGSHNGKYPPDLTLFADQPCRCCTRTSMHKWNEYYYVSGLTVDDPPMCPILIYLPSKKGVKKAVVWFNEGGCSFPERWKAEHLIKSPVRCKRNRPGVIEFDPSSQQPKGPLIVLPPLHETK